ncbi:prenyltransferase [Halorientalis sp. IM1011]|uniref:UbiA family prenyltransferase n=1 Tax=Halorientalis sp. IM1011 TaxID=1932360 RepID=UPI00097CCE8C|nr:UbiA family prenyltransferase [Halorientalis sp. IM1011]AQL42380.1 prenyltransferase [Halorientalis sp. IM1011]
MTHDTLTTGRVRMAVSRAITVAVHSNVLIAVAAASVAVTASLLCDYPIAPLPVGIVFAATLFVYGCNRLTDLAEDERNLPGRAAFTRRYGRPLAAVGTVLYLGTVGLAFARDLPGASFLWLPAAVAGLYSLGRLKRIFLVKNLLVGVSWGIVPLGVGVYFGTIRPPLVAFAGYVAVMLTTAAVVFDVKDVAGDRREGIRTVPVLFGPATTRRVAQLTNLGAAGAVVALVWSGLLPARFLVLLAFNAYVGCYVPLATPDRGPLFYGFVIDGEHVFLAALVVVLDAVGWLG